jgi:hypothetical protein
MANPSLPPDSRNRLFTDFAADRQSQLGADPGGNRLLHGLRVEDRECGDVREALPQDLGENGGRVHRPRPRRNCHTGRALRSAPRPAGWAVSPLRGRPIAATARSGRQSLALDPGSTQQLVTEIFRKLAVAVSDDQGAQSGVGDVGMPESGKEARSQGAPRRSSRCSGAPVPCSDDRRCPAA